MRITFDPSNKKDVMRAYEYAIENLRELIPPVSEEHAREIAAVAGIEPNQVEEDIKEAIKIRHKHGELLYQYFSSGRL